jgi:hypothetical protein
VSLELWRVACYLEVIGGKPDAADCTLPAHLLDEVQLAGITLFLDQEIISVYANFKEQAR